MADLNSLFYEAQTTFHTSYSSHIQSVNVIYDEDYISVQHKIRADL